MLSWIVTLRRKKIVVYYQCEDKTWRAPYHSENQRYFSLQVDTEWNPCPIEHSAKSLWWLKWARISRIIFIWSFESKWKMIHFDVTFKILPSYYQKLQYLSPFFPIPKFWLLLSWLRCNWFVFLSLTYSSDQAASDNLQHLQTICHN